MYQFCFEIAGRRHCFDVPTLIDQNVIKRPPPNNLPPFDLAVSVLLLVDAVPPSELSSELSHIATRYIEQLANRLPANVQLISSTKSQTGAVA